MHLAMSCWLIACSLFAFNTANNGKAEVEGWKAGIMRARGGGGGGGGGGRTRAREPPSQPPLGPVQEAPQILLAHRPQQVASPVSLRA